MGETTCLMQPFSYASGISNEEGNPIHGLGQSISFGRFMSESLAWEKWSTFSHNRYVEEAERYSRPGSVAQKKAFFEAHYKKMAARKKAAAEAALLEQSNAASINDPEEETDGDPEITSNAQTDADKNEEAVVQNGKAGLVVDANEHNSNVVMSKSENEVAVEDSVKVESSSQIGVVDDRSEVKDLKPSENTQLQKPLLKDFNSNQDKPVSASEKKPALSFSKSLSYGRASKLPSSPAKPTVSTRSMTENYATPISKKCATDFMDNAKASKLPFSSAEFTGPTKSMKEKNATPISKLSAICSANEKGSTIKSSHKSINFTPAREINRLTSTIIRKFDSSRIGSNSKASKDCSTPAKTPVTASANGAKHPLATPWSENKRTRTPRESSALASKTVRAKWNFLPTDCSKLLSACRNKAQSPNLSTPFRLRTEERAAKRKEKLEEKFNAHQQQKVQQQATLKERAENELKRLRPTLCFKARPLPDFYKERGTPKNEMKKGLLTRPQSPKFGKKPASSCLDQSTASQPLQRPSIKKIGSKQVSEKNNRTPSYSLALRHAKVTHENTSPNIQHR